MAVAESGQDRPRRTLARDERRRQVIEATIGSIATQGLARLTLTDVARAAGISHGLVLFHFASKENLLYETLTHLAEEYERNWRDSLAAAGPHPADRLLALVEADFHPAINTPSRLAAWCAFWGEAQSRPFYQTVCGARDAAQIACMEALCADLSGDEPSAPDPAEAARILRFTVEGAWLEVMTQATAQPQAEAHRTALTVLRLCFPRHFPRPARAGG